MALDKAKLKTELLKLLDPDNPSFVGFPADASAAAQNWADAYDAYASDAEDVSGDAVASKNPTGFKSALILADGNAVAAAALEFDNAFVAYWTGAVFAVGTPPSSGVGGTGVYSVELSSNVTVAAPAVLSAALSPIFTAIETDQDPDVKAGKIADAFHDATTTAVTVLIAGLDTSLPPPAGPGPLPITTTDFVY